MLPISQHGLDRLQTEQSDTQAETYFAFGRPYTPPSHDRPCSVTLGDVSPNADCRSGAVEWWENPCGVASRCSGRSKKTGDGTGAKFPVKRHLAQQKSPTAENHR